MYLVQLHPFPAKTPYTVESILMQWFLLCQPWVENTLNTTLLVPPVDDRGPYSWLRRRADFDVWSAPARVHQGAPSVLKRSEDERREAKRVEHEKVSEH